MSSKTDLSEGGASEAGDEKLPGALRAAARGQAFRAAMNQLLIGVPATGALLMATLYYFDDVADAPMLSMLGGALGVLAVVNGSWALHWRRQPLDRRVRPSDVRALVLALAVWGVLWAALGGHLFVVADSDRERVLVASVIAALMGAGGWMYSSVAEASLAWIVSLCVGVWLGIWPMRNEGFGALLLLLPLYAITIAAAAVMTSRLFADRLAYQRALENQTRLVSFLLRDFQEHSSDWLWETDRDGLLSHVSQRLGEQLGLPRPTLQGQHLLDALPPHGPEEAARHAREALARELDGQGAFREVIVPVKTPAGNRWWSLSAKPLRDGTGRVSGWRGVGTDVTALRERDLELTRLVNIDTVTGLASRHCFHERLKQHFDDGSDELAACTLLMLDLDNFKSLNDSLGHDAGDELLAELGRRLGGLADDQKLVARLGGDEFAILIFGVHASDADARLLARLEEVLRPPCVIAEHRVEVRFSIGIAHAPDDATSAQELLKAADLALYAVKGAGGNSSKRFVSAMRSAARARFELLADLRTAIEREQFVVYYQPQLSLRERRLQGFEALVRWQHPVNGLVPPATFIPLAEDSGLILELGAWVMRRACLDAAAWPSDLRVAVNVSAVEIERCSVRASVGAALSSSGLPARRLELELTESALLQNADEAISLLGELRSGGIGVALDDFGTGFSSLGYLRSFPLDKLKIDRSFVSALDASLNARTAGAIVRAIRELAGALGLATTAEGVETEEQAQILEDLGCDHAQGYGFGRPMPAQEVAKFIERHRSAQVPFTSSEAAYALSQASPVLDVRKEARRIAGGSWPRLPAVTNEKQD